MPLIKARTRGKQLVRLVTRFDRENHEALHAYAHFIGEPVEYVLNQLVDTVLTKDKEFASWRAEHPQSFVAPRKPPRGRQQARRHAARQDAAHALGDGHGLAPTRTPPGRDAREVPDAHPA